MNDAWTQPPAPRIRPRRFWYVIAVLVLVLGVAAGIGALVFSLRPATGSLQHFDTTHPARVQLTSGQQRTLYVESGTTGSTECRATPDGLGLDEVSGSLTVSRGDEEWTGVYQLRADRAGTYQVSCTNSAGTARLVIGGYLSLPRLMGGIAAVFVCPGGAFLFAAIVCLVVALRRHSARKRAAAPPPPAAG